MPRDETLGFLQLCADRRYHRKTMEAFERATGLVPDQYWIEAAAGGAAALGPTPTARFAYEQGATVMGWAGHGDGCGGFPARADAEIEEMVTAAASRGAKDFPAAEHWTLFGAGGKVEAERSG